MPLLDEQNNSFFVIHTIFSFSSCLVRITIPCHSRQGVHAKILLVDQLGSSQLVPASMKFPHNACLRHHYGNHFPESLTWSYLQFSTPLFAQGRQSVFVLAVTWITHSTIPDWLTTILFVRFAHNSVQRCPVRTTSTSNFITFTPTLIY